MENKIEELKTQISQKEKELYMLRAELQYYATKDVVNPITHTLEYSPKAEILEFLNQYSTGKPKQVVTYIEGKYGSKLDLQKRNVISTYMSQLMRLGKLTKDNGLYSLPKQPTT